jgi:hypothetical protein
MTTPEWLKPGIWGAIVGAAAIGIVGFTWGGWVTTGTANDRAMAMSHDEVVAAMVPVCLELSRTDPDRLVKLTGIRDLATYRRRDALMEAGWATVPGSDAPDRDIAGACLASLDVDAMDLQPASAEDQG